VCVRPLSLIKPNSAPSQQVSGPCSTVLAIPPGSCDEDCLEPEPGVRHMHGAVGPSHQPTKPLVRKKIKHNGHVHNSEDEDTSDGHIDTALEEACGAWYSEEDIAAMLEPGGDYKEELLSWKAVKTGYNNLNRISIERCQA